MNEALILVPTLKVLLSKENSKVDLKGTKSQKAKPVVICGSCGAVEHYISHNKTECPNCDDYMY